MMVASKTEDYQLHGDVLDQGLKELGSSGEDLNVELFASDKQHVLDLYCSKGQNYCYKFCWPSFGMVYGNARFSELGKVLPQVPLERSRMVLCLAVWGAYGGNEYYFFRESYAYLHPAARRRHLRACGSQDAYWETSGLDEESDPQSRLRQYVDSERGDWR